MTRTVYRFTFDPDVSMDDVRKSLAISTIAVESIYGEQAMNLDGKFALKTKRRTCLIDSGTQLGCDLAKVFGGFMTTIGDGGFQVDVEESREPLGDMLELLGAYL